jgi:O-antigen/teichoic acid export membrane protein
MGKISFNIMILKKINTFLNKGSERTTLVKKNILANFFIKGLSVLISLLYVPITLNYLNPTRYGIWMTLTSLVAWMGIFDIGLGNGLRNKLAEALAIGDKEKAKIYVSNAYAILSIIVGMVLLLFFIANHWINWSLVLNTTATYREELTTLTLIIVILFGLKFILNIISTVFTADQRPAIGSIFELIGSAIGLLIIWILTLTNKTSLITFGLATMLTPVIIYLIASLVFYNNKYNQIKPSWKSIDLYHAKELTGLGFQFFVIQIAVLVIFQTSNILIAQFFSPAEVTPYNIVFKYFSIITLIWGIVMAPLWSAFTQAKIHNDIEWIKKTIAKLNIFMFLTIFIILFMALGAIKIISFWTSGQIIVKPVMIWIFALYTLISIWNTIYSFFLNGVSKIKIQIYTSILAAILNIPIAFLLIKQFGMGSEGVVLSMAISLSFFAVAGPIQSFKLLKAWKKS